MDDGRTSVLFVCLGNICRSPLAEGVLRHVLRDRGLEERYAVESAGTGAYHVGEPPDRRSVEVARRNGVVLEGEARQVESSDLHDFDWVVAMDRSNLAHLERMREEAGGEARITLLREFDPEQSGDEVPDPYYGGPRGFDDVYEMVRRSLEALVDHMEAEREEEGA